MKATILYYSKSGNTKTRAEQIREGMERVEGAEVKTFSIDEIDMDWIKDSDCVILGAPTYYAESARVKNSLIADGCRIEGTVENSILFRGVTVAPGAVVRNSVVMQSSAIGKGACLGYVIADKRVRIGAGSDLHGSVTYPFVIAKGMSV